MEAAAANAIGSVGRKCRCDAAGWSSLVARRAHNPKVVGSNPSPATKENPLSKPLFGVAFLVLVLIKAPVSIICQSFGRVRYGHKL